jgi:hypothetical protein
MYICTEWTGSFFHLRKVESMSLSKDIPCLPKDTLTLLKQGEKILGLELVDNKIVFNSDYFNEKYTTYSPIKYKYHYISNKVIVYNNQYDIIFILDNQGNLLYKIPVFTGDILNIVLGKGEMLLQYQFFTTTFELKSNGQFVSPKYLVFNDDKKIGVPVHKLYAEELLLNLGINNIVYQTTYLQYKDKYYRKYRCNYTQDILVHKDEVLVYSQGCEPRLIYKG